MLTQSRLKALLTYDSETGRFTRLIEGTPVVLNPRKRLCVDGNSYEAGKLAWLWMEGSIPEKTVLHLNFERLDFCWRNLALADPSQLRAARKPWGKEGKGVSFCAGRPKPWRAIICDRGKNRHLGSFATRAEASATFHAEYLKKYGKFARLA